MQIFNADGGEVSACGNATRCVAYLLHKRTAKKHLMIETKAGLVSADVEGGLVSIVLPAPATNPERVPLTRALRSQDFSIASLHDPQGVNVGNPHIVFFPDWDSPLPALTDFGAALNHKHPLIPEGANIEWVKIVSPQHLQLQVYERGVGVTMSCGTGACAAVVAAHEQGLSAKSCRVSLQGGDLTIEILPDKRLVLRGPVCYVCEGVLSI